MTVEKKDEKKAPAKSVKTKAWITPAKTRARASVDGIRVGNGKENAAELSDNQIERLRASGIELATDKD